MKRAREASHDRAAAFAARVIRIGTNREAVNLARAYTQLRALVVEIGADAAERDERARSGLRGLLARVDDALGGRL